MRADMTVLCGHLAWPVHPPSVHSRLAPRGPTFIPTAATVEVFAALNEDTQRWVSFVRYEGRTYTLPTSLLATPDRAFASLKKKGK